MFRETHVFRVLPLKANWDKYLRGDAPYTYTTACSSVRTFWEYQPAAKNPLRRIAINLLSVVPTSAELERTFSWIGKFSVTSRANLRVSSLEMLAQMQSELRYKAATQSTVGAETAALGGGNPSGPTPMQSNEPGVDDVFEIVEQENDADEASVGMVDPELEREISELLTSLHIQRILAGWPEPLYDINLLNDEGSLNPRLEYEEEFAEFGDHVPWDVDTVFTIMPLQ